MPLKKPDVTEQSGNLLAGQPIWLARWYDYRTTDWANYLEYPEFILKQTQQLLRIGI